MIGRCFSIRCYSQNNSQGFSTLIVRERKLTSRHCTMFKVGFPGLPTRLAIFCSPRVQLVQNSASLLAKPSECQLNRRTVYIASVAVDSCIWVSLAGQSRFGQSRTASRSLGVGSALDLVAANSSGNTPCIFDFVVFVRPVSTFQRCVCSAGILLANKVQRAHVRSLAYVVWLGSIISGFLGVIFLVGQWALVGNILDRAHPADIERIHRRLARA